MEIFSALLAICAGKSPVTGEFPSQRPVTRSFDVSLICAWINGWVNNREAGDLRRHRAHYDVIVMTWRFISYLYACVFTPAYIIRNIAHSATMSAITRKNSNKQHSQRADQCIWLTLGQSIWEQNISTRFLQLYIKHDCSFSLVHILRYLTSRGQYGVLSKYVVQCSLQCVTVHWTELNWRHPSSCASWWRHQMETFSALLALCAGNSPVTGEFPAQRPVTRSFGVFFDLCLNKQLSKQSRRWWFETPSSPLWRHCNVYTWAWFCDLHAFQMELFMHISYMSMVVWL